MASLALPFTKGEDDFDGAYLFGGGEARVSRGARVMGEAWIGQNGSPDLFLIGTRLIGDGYSVEFAAVLPEGADFVLPLVSVTI